MCITRMPEGSMTLKKKKKELALAGEGREDLMYVDCGPGPGPPARCPAEPFVEGSAVAPPVLRPGN